MSGPFQPFVVASPTSPQSDNGPESALLSALTSISPSGNLFTRLFVVLRPPHPPLTPNSLAGILPPIAA